MDKWNRIFLTSGSGDALVALRFRRGNGNFSRLNHCDGPAPLLPSFSGLGGYSTLCQSSLKHGLATIGHGVSKDTHCGLDDLRARIRDIGRLPEADLPPLRGSKSEAEEGSRVSAT